MKAATMGLGVKCLMTDFGAETNVQINTASSAARIIPSRRGAGRVRHIEVW